MKHDDEASDGLIELGAVALEDLMPGGDKSGVTKNDEDRAINGS
jgi:hypothetical protein